MNEYVLNKLKLQSKVDVNISELAIMCAHGSRIALKSRSSILSNLTQLKQKIYMFTFTDYFKFPIIRGRHSGSRIPQINSSTRNEHFELTKC